jgi:hypothetical protein
VKAREIPRIDVDVAFRELRNVHPRTILLDDLLRSLGSGSVGVAAARLGRRFLGTDDNSEAVRLAER